MAGLDYRSAPASLVRCRALFFPHITVIICAAEGSQRGEWRIFVGVWCFKEEAEAPATPQMGGEGSHHAAERPGTSRGIKRRRKPLGWRAMAPCVTSPHPETDLPEAKKLRLCLQMRVEALRQKPKVKAASSLLFLVLVLCPCLS